MTLPNGRPPAFTSVEEFEKGCESYIQWVKNTPQEKTITAHYQGEIIDRRVNFLRPMTVHGLASHLGVALSTLQDYGTKDGFSVIYKETRSKMTAYNIDGATSGDFNQAIIARIEGLADKQENNTTVTVNSLDDFYAEQSESNT